MTISGNKKSLNLFLLTMIHIATILSIKNWPFMTKYGLASVFYLVISALLFFIPVSLVSAELASGWPKKGGIFVWVKEAFGSRVAFLSVWLMWISNVVWYPTILSFVAISISYAFCPHLSNHPLFHFLVITITFWTLLIANCLGMKFSSRLSTLATMLGTIVPGLLIIGFGSLWYFSGQPSQIEFSWKNLLPQSFKIDELTFLMGVLLGFAGIEMNAIHSKDVVNPQKNYPRSVFFACIVILLFSMLGTLSISLITPASHIDLVGAAIESISFYLKSYHIQWLIPVVSTLIGLGALGGVSVWIAGPSRGLCVAAKERNIPNIFTQTNRHDMPVPIMILQGVIVTMMSLSFLIMPSLNSSFWFLIVLASQLYVLMYILMFVTVIVLRYKKPEVKRDYKLPGGKVGLWIISGTGLIGSLAALLIGFYPPAELETGNPVAYVICLFFGIVAFSILPLFFGKKKTSELLESSVTD